MSSHLAPSPSALAVRSAVRRPSRRSGVFAASFTLALGLVLPAGLAPAQGLSLSGFSPAGAAPGELVTLTGSGFASDPADHFTFVLGPPGHGVLLEPLEALPGTLQAWLGPSASTFEGPVCLWLGRRHVLPGSLIGGETGAWKVHLAEFFVPAEAAAAPKTFRVEDTTPRTRFGTLDENELVVVVERDSAVDPTRIDLVVMIDGGGCGGNTKPGGVTPLQKAPALPGRAFHLRLENIDPIQVADPGALARDLALVLQSTFGAVGLVATAEGSTVHIAWSRLDTVENAFGVLHFEH